MMHASLFKPSHILRGTPQDPPLSSSLRSLPSSKVSFVGSKAQRFLVATSASLSISESNSRAPVSVKNSNGPIIVIDNYDSFTYNLCQYLGELGYKFDVYRNDELTVEELKSKNPRGVLISPGPGTPQDSGISLQTVLELGPLVPLFGVCMGLQCIGEAFGGKIVRSPFGVMHGKSSLVYYDEKGEDGLFSGLSKNESTVVSTSSIKAGYRRMGAIAIGLGTPADELCSSRFADSSGAAFCCTSPFTVGRYHSLVIEKESFPSESLEVTAWTEDGLIMAARHKTYKHIQGVQFHPESIITTEGRMIVQNFIKLVEKKEAGSPQ